MTDPDPFQSDVLARFLEKIFATIEGTKLGSTSLQKLKQKVFMLSLVQELRESQLFSFCKQLMMDCSDGEMLIYLLEQFQQIYPENVRDPSAWGHEGTYYFLVNKLETDQELRDHCRPLWKLLVESTRSIPELKSLLERIQRISRWGFIGDLKHRDDFPTHARNLAAYDEERDITYPSLEERIVSSKNLEEARRPIQQLAEIGLAQLSFHPDWTSRMTDHLRSLPGGQLPGQT